MHAQLRSVTLYIAQQLSVAPCGAVRCGAVPIASVLCRAALCAFFRTWSSTGYNTCCCVLRFFFFIFLHVFVWSFTAPCFFPHANYPRTADQNVTPVTKAHSRAGRNRAICSKQLLALSNRCSHQIMGFFLAPLHVFSCILPCLARAREAGPLYILLHGSPPGSA